MIAAVVAIHKRAASRLTLLFEFRHIHETIKSIETRNTIFALSIIPNTEVVLKHSKISAANTEESSFFLNAFEKTNPNIAYNTAVVTTYSRSIAYSLSVCGMSVPIK